MTATLSVPHTTLTFTPTRAQVDLIRRSGIRVTPLDGTRKLLSRVCKCGRVEEREIDTEDTPRNRWETQQTIERLSGTDWRCATCRVSVLALPTHRGGGNGGNGGGSRKRRPSTHKTPRARRPSIKQLREVLDYYQDALEAVLAGEVFASAAQINRWTAYRNEAQAALRERGVRV